MEIIGYNETTGQKTTFGNYPEQLAPRKDDIFYLPNGSCVKCQEVRIHYDTHSISVHYSH